MRHCGIRICSKPFTSTKASIGKTLGARILVAGKLMKLDNDWTVTARLMDTETSELKAIRVTGSASDGIAKLASATGDAIAQKLASSPLQHAGANDSLEPEIEKLRASLAGKALPRVAVHIPETHIGARVPDPAGENEIERVLAEVGFPIADTSTFMKREESSSWLNIFWGAAQQRQGTEVAVNSGFHGRGDAMYNKNIDKLKQNADILVVVEAFSESAGQQYGFNSCKCRIEVKALDTKTETIALASSQHAVAADTAEFVAGKQALKNAGGQLGLDLARRLAEYWDKKGK